MLDPKRLKSVSRLLHGPRTICRRCGAKNSFLQTISEIALTGYVGTEIGCQFPRDPAILNKEFERSSAAAVFPPSPAGSAPI